MGINGIIKNLQSVRGQSAALSLLTLCKPMT
nr:MAG TPA: hypothetical protein [Inoviridae sp.]